MSSNIEINGPAFIQTALDQAGNALTQEKLSEVRDILLEAEKINGRVIAWLKELAAAGVMLPVELTWSKYTQHTGVASSVPVLGKYDLVG